MGFFGAAHGWGGVAKRPPVPKICHTYPTMIKLGTVIPYPRKIQKIYKSRDTPLQFCWHQHFFTGNQHILIYQEIQIQIAFWYLISNSFNFSWVFKDCFVKHGNNFDDASKNGYPRPSWNKGYDVIISVHDVLNKILSRDLNYIVDAVMWPKFGNCSISMRKVIVTSIL